MFGNGQRAMGGAAPAEAPGDQLTSGGSRQRWSSPFSFVLASVGSAIGFGNIWRFPKLCFHYGGGAFLIPYGCALVFCAIPVVVLEFALGQRFQVGHVRMMTLAAGAPRVGWAAGFGWAAVLGTFLLAQFYCALLAITLCYLIASFFPELPWAGGPAHDFFAYVVQPSASVSDGGGLVPHLTGAYLFVWVIVTLSAVKSSASIELLNKIVMPVPFIVLIVFLCRGLTLPGAFSGVRALFTPDLSALASVEIWITAVSQLFFGVSAGLGTLTTYASFNPRDAPVVRSAILVCIANSAFSLLAGVTVFSFLGHLAHERGCSISDVVNGGSSLAFEVFPVAFASLPFPHFWAVSFFLMLLNLGVSSAVSMTSPLATSISEALLSAKANSGAGRAEAVAGDGHRRCPPGALPTLAVHVVGFVSGLLYVTHAGSHWVDLGDHFVPLYLTVIVGLSECVLITHIYGAKRLLSELPAADQRFGAWWRFCWSYLIPATLSVLLVAQIVHELTSPFGSVPPRDADAPNASALDESAANASLYDFEHRSCAIERVGNSSFLPPNRTNGQPEGLPGTPYTTWAYAVGWTLALGPTLLAPCCALYAWRRRRGPQERVVGRVVELTVTDGPMA